MTHYDFIRLQEILYQVNEEPNNRMLIAVTEREFKDLVVVTWTELADKKPGFRFKYMGFKCILIADDEPCPICGYLEGEHKLFCPNNPKKLPKIMLDL